MHSAKEVLKKVYGYDTFRPGQEGIVQDIVNKRDTLAILPTGGGKSLCYQIPALLLSGTTLVISPLISLMKDQVDALLELDVPAAFLNSSLSAEEYRQTLANAFNGEYKLLYISPERFDAPMFQSLTEQLHIPFIAIDEAHCVSQWGHDFRPSYRQLAQSIAKLENRPVIAAFTATATPEVAEDIVSMLNMYQPAQYVTGFARPNLSLSVVTGVNKRQFLQDFLKTRLKQKGIVYTATRKGAEEVHEQLVKQSIKTELYHGGLSDKQRKEAQEKFRYDEVKIMVATNAFGMGIDEPDIRFIVHWQMPGDLESYYQEAGRAGRDGEESECILLFDASDIQIHRFLIDQSLSDENRKMISTQKLHMMMNYCRTEQCLQQYIVDYFGELHVQSCGKCSSCLDTSERFDCTKEALMVISCVARMRGRFGVTMVAKVLKGSSDKRLLQAKLNTLTTYGLMKHRAEKDIADFVNYLVAEQYLLLSDGQYPVVQVAEKAKNVITGNETVWQKRRSQVREVLSNTSDEATPLFMSLKQWRLDQAKAERIPPFMIFSDASLRLLAELRPKTETDLLNVRGVGQAKVTKYGQQLLNMLNED